MTDSKRPFKIQTPCPLAWESLSPGNSEEVRFCGQCNKEVYDASAVTEEEARAHVARQGGEACISLITLPGGRPLHRNPDGPAAGISKIVIAATAALAAACSGDGEGSTVVPGRQAEQTSTETSDEDFEMPAVFSQHMTLMLADPETRTWATEALAKGRPENWKPSEDEISRFIFQELNESKLRGLGYFAP